MSPNKINEELIEIAKSLGFRIRRDGGNFKSNNCILKNQKIIIFNKISSVKSQNLTLGFAIKQQNLDDLFIKPAIRDFLENELDEKNNSFLKEIDFLES